MVTNKNNPNQQQGENASSIFSLTLNEFQHLCENGKSFGSMNMEEFLNSVCTAEENHGQGIIPIATGTTSRIPRGETFVSKGKGILTHQPSLARQGSLTIPEPLSRKTVEEVWSEIHNKGSLSHKRYLNATQKQSTFADMTLEDFLVGAGVVRETNNIQAPPQQPFYVNRDQLAMSHDYGTKPMLTIGAGIDLANYRVIPDNRVGEGSGYSKGGGFLREPVKNGNVGFGEMTVYRPPVNPVVFDGNQADDGDEFSAMDLAVVRGGRRRVIEAPVVERRQRRMIKNRESAARSRARKQAYTVELEAELNYLKEENARLRQALDEAERQRKQLCYADAKANANMQTKAQKANRKLQRMRRCSSCFY